MNNFDFLSPTRLVVGKNAEQQTPKWIKAYGGHKVLVHHDSGFVDRVIEILKKDGLDVVELGGVVPNPHLSKVYGSIGWGKRLYTDDIVNFLKLAL